jgi:hypothetical protein
VGLSGEASNFRSEFDNVKMVTSKIIKKKVNRKAKEILINLKRDTGSSKKCGNM